MKLTEAEKAELERVSETAVCKRVRGAGGLCVKFGQNGYPDRVVICGGRVVFVEFKRPGEHLRAEQRYIVDVMRRQGADVRVVAGKKAAEELCDELGV